MSKAEPMAHDHRAAIYRTQRAGRPLTVRQARRLRKQDKKRMAFLIRRLVKED